MSWTSSCLMKSLKRPFHQSSFLSVSIDIDTRRLTVRWLLFVSHCLNLTVSSWHGFCIIEKSNLTSIPSFIWSLRAFFFHTEHCLFYKWMEMKTSKTDIPSEVDKTRCMLINSISEPLQWSPHCISARFLWWESHRTNERTNERERSNRQTCLCYPQVKRPIMSLKEKHHQWMFI